MRSRPFAAALILAALLPAGSASAEPLGQHFQLSPIAGFTMFDGDFRYPGAAPLRDNLYAGARVGWMYRPWIGIEGAFGLVPTSEDRDGGADANLWHGSGNLLVSPWTTRWGDAFLTGGFGYGEVKASGADALPMGLIELGGGLRMWMTDEIGLRIEARTLNWARGESSQESYTHLMLGGGLTFALGARTRDTDADGVPDKRDKCPDTPHGATVNADGCPGDTDGDGVLDGIDQCAATPKGCTVDAKGCPSDADGDGVCDGLDTCADTPAGATVDAKGCPIDSDGDGVFDGIDKCADTKKGCTVDAVGCPADADSDGVCNGLDQCPDTPRGLQVDEKGCTMELIERETELLDTGMIRLHDVNFETGKAVILPESFASLDIVGTLLSSWPQLRIEIGGHTDGRGSTATNQKLSETRARAVETYLLQKFPALKNEQFTPKGYGESQPIAPNNNATNMARNRRVEFKVMNRDVLRKETERRRLLKQGEALPDTTKH